MKLGATSLSGQLNQSIVMLVCSFWLIGSAAVGWYVNKEVAESLDSALAQSADRLLELAAHEIDEARSHTTATSLDAAATPPLASIASSNTPTSTPIAVATHENQHHDEEIHGDYLMYQVVDSTGALLMRSADAPAVPFTAELKPGFSQTTEWRVYTLRHPTQALFIHTADAVSQRQQLRDKSLTFLLLPLLAVLPLLMLMVRYIVRFRLRAVGNVTAQLHLRGGKNLAPVDTRGLPDELTLLVDNVNRLLIRLDEALQTERALSANAAHELRTPLTIAQLRLSNLMSMGLPETARIEVTSANTALTHLKRRTEKLLQLSRAESGAALAQDCVSLNRVVAAVLLEFELAAYRRLQVIDTTDVVVLGDFDTIAIALRNLIENSLRYSDPSPVEVHIETTGALTVRDAGPGVSPEQLANLTHRHVRHAQGSAGFGLGLSIVKTIMARHQGALQLASPPPDQSQGFEARLVFQVAAPSAP